MYLPKLKLTACDVNEYLIPLSLLYVVPFLLMFPDISMVQDDEVEDRTTSVAVLTCELTEGQPLCVYCVCVSDNHGSFLSVIRPS